MSRIIMAILVLVLLFSNITVIPVQAAPFPNGGFETNPAGGNNDWVAWTTGWAWDTSTAHSGTHSARVSRSSGSESGTLWSAFVAVQPSYVYNLTFWLRTSSANFYPRVVLYQYTSAKTQTGPYILAYPNIGTGTNGWTQVQYRFQTNPNAAFLRIRLYLYTDTTGTFWFDDFSLDSGTPAAYAFLPGFPVATTTGSVMLASPTVADINKDGANELLINGGSAINGWNKNGNPLAGYPLTTGDRTIVGQIAVEDLDQNGSLEIAAGTQTAVTNGQCSVYLWYANGSRMSGWPQKVAWETTNSASACWIPTVVLKDIDGDQKPEVIAGSTNNGARNPYAGINTPNLYAWHPNGTLLTGSWPNYQDKMTTAIYGAVAVGDISGDGKADIVVARDYIYLNAYGANGLSLPGWPIRSFVNGNNLNYDTEKRIEFSVNAPIIADLDNDGRKETIVAGHVKGPGNNNAFQTSALIVLEPDGTRRPGWETAAVGRGILAAVDMPWQAPAVADLDGDGKLEIVVATEDGWIRAYKENKTLLWEMNYTQGGTIFGSEPVIGDINDDGKLEIVFGTYVPGVISTDKDGPVGLWGLSADGKVLPGFPLAIPTPGVRSAPTIADLDGDGKLDILAATRNGQVFAWRTQAAYQSTRLPWPTGRHDIARSGFYTNVGEPNPSPTPTFTPVRSSTPTTIRTTTSTATRTPTPTITRTGLPTSTRTPTAAPTFTRTPTAAPTFTRTPTAMPTNTPIGPPSIVTLTSISVGSYDGYIVETNENSNLGGTYNATSTTFQLGDDSNDRQYKSILSFNTAALPDSAIIQSVTLKIKQYDIPVGTDPFTIMGSLLVDMRKGAFSGANALSAADFQALPSEANVAVFDTPPASGWYSAILSPTGLNTVNKVGVTQFRLYFTSDDNDDLGSDYIKFISGNSTSASKPQMIITYTLP